MNKRMIIFDANEQRLQRRSELLHIASGTVNYVKAEFTLGDNWQNYDKVVSAWDNGLKKSFAELDREGCCIVPADVLADKGTVKVNLVGKNGSIEVLTTYPIEAVKVNALVPLDGEPCNEIR